MKNNRKSIIIIGAGLGGMSSGCYARMNGYDAQIFEMHEIPGGCCTSWERRDYTFDQCISWLLGSGPDNKMNQIWNELGALDGKSIQNFDVFNRVYTQQGQAVDFYSNPEQLEKHLLEISPQDKEPIQAFCSDLREFYALTDAHPFLKPFGLMSIVEKIRMLAPYLKRFKLVGKAHSTLMTDFAATFKSETLQEAFNFIMFEKHASFPLLPFYFNIACAALKNAGVPQGGSLGLSKSIEKRYLELGGEINYNCKVEKILVDNDKAIGVKLVDGREFNSDIVIAAGDGLNTINNLLDGQYSNSRIDTLYKEMINKDELVFPSYFTLFLGVDKDYSGNSHCSTFVLDPSMMQQLPGMKHASINVQVRSQYYPHTAPAGKSVLFISFFCDYQPWSDMCAEHSGDTPLRNNMKSKNRNKKRHTKRRRTIEYRTEKKRAANILIDFLGQYFEGLKENIEYTDIATPLTQERYTGNRHGTVLAWQPFLSSGEFIEKTVKKQGPAIPGLANFYMAGHWTTTGGLIRAASSGRHVIQYICKDDKKKFNAFIGTGNTFNASNLTVNSEPG
ncbi:MAG: NAD(P)/FAD-dependent oxidoreductase [Gammaproteobacteria bacterium]|nr:NAD(P)/FAD-dependent oxidoreductase [Gammaproteobacteria bacterium]